MHCPHRRDFVELLAPLLELLGALGREAADRRMQRLAMLFFHRAVDPRADTPGITARRPERPQLRRRAEIEDLLPFVGLLIDERDVAARQDFPRLVQRAGEAVARARGPHRIIEMRGDEVRYGHTLDLVAEIVGLAGIAGFDQVAE